MAKVGGMFPSKYIKADDLQGRMVPVVVDRVDPFVDVGTPDKPDQKPVMYFQGKTKGLVLNKTNAEMAAAVFADDETDNWAGREIVLRPDKVSFNGRIVDCIRLQAPMQQASPAAAPEPTAPAAPDEEFPF